MSIKNEKFCDLCHNHITEGDGIALSISKRVDGDLYCFSRIFEMSGANDIHLHKPCAILIKNLLNDEA